MSKPNPSEVRQILFVTLSNLGDVTLTLPVLESLRQRYPGAFVDVVVGEGSALVFQRDDRIREVMPYQKKSPLADKFRLLMKIRRTRYDLIVDLRRSLLGLLGASRHRNSYLRPLPGRRSHRLVRHLYALKGLASKSLKSSFLAARVPEQPADDVLSEWAASLDPLKKLIVVFPGSKSDLKKWPAERYAALLDRLASEENCQVVLAGDHSDSRDSQKVHEKMLRSAPNLTGRTSFTDLLWLLRKADLVITNDSAPLHLADALKVPVLAIFGPTDPKKYGPRYRHSAVARRQLFCAPCEKAQCRFRHECLLELGVDEVHQKALSILRDEWDRKNFKVLLVRLDRIGDVVLSIPAIEAVRERFPNAFISVMTRPETSSILEGHPAVDEVISYAYQTKGRHAGILGNFRFIREIAKHHFDLALILNPSLRSYLVPWVAGIPYRIGFKTTPSFLLTGAVPDERHRGSRHESEYTLDIVRAFGIQPEERRAPRLYPPWEVREQVRRRLAGELPNQPARIMAVHVGASCPSKRWPSERFAELLDRLHAKYPDHRFILVGGSAERPLSKGIADTRRDWVLDWTGKLLLRELMALLSDCELLISNDSGPVHMAAAVQTPTLTIFGRNQPGLGMARWKALGRGHRQIHKDVGCVICLAHACPIQFECLRAVTVDEVLSLAESMMNSTETAGR